MNHLTTKLKNKNEGKIDYDSVPLLTDKSKND